jgi:hypothetical protein
MVITMKGGRSDCALAGWIVGAKDGWGKSMTACSPPDPASMIALSEFPPRGSHPSSESEAGRFPCWGPSSATMVRWGILGSEYAPVMAYPKDLGGF